MPPQRSLVDFVFGRFLSLIQQMAHGFPAAEAEGQSGGQNDSAHNQDEGRKENVPGKTKVIRGGNYSAECEESPHKRG
jgi:hypothetical protein